MKKIFFTMLFVVNTFSAFAHQKSLVTPSCVLPENSLRSTSQSLTLRILEQAWNSTWILLANDAFFDLGSDPADRFSLMFKQTDEINFENDFDIYNAFFSNPLIEAMARSLGIKKMTDVSSIFVKKAELVANSTYELQFITYSVYDGAGTRSVSGVFFDNVLINCL